MREIERRAVPELRAAKDEAKIEGYAAVFNSLSQDLGGFREIILPGAFDRALRESHDVRALVDHDPSRILGRTKSGTLTLSVDDKGLRVQITPPDTQAARDVLTSIRRGDLDGMSFAFRTLTDNWRTQDGEMIREVVDVEVLDVSVVAYPAYQATEVSAHAVDAARSLMAAQRPTPPTGVPNEINEARLRLQD